MNSVVRDFDFFASPTGDKKGFSIDLPVLVDGRLVTALDVKVGSKPEKVGRRDERVASDRIRSTENKSFEGLVKKLTFTTTNRKRIDQVVDDLMANLLSLHSLDRFGIPVPGRAS